METSTKPEIDVAELPPFCLYDEEGVVLVDERGRIVLGPPENVVME